MKLNKIIAKFKILAGAPVLSVFVCLLLAATLAAVVLICSRDDAHTDKTPVSAPGRVNTDEIDIPNIDGASSTDSASNNSNKDNAPNIDADTDNSDDTHNNNNNNNGENVTTDDDNDEIASGEFIFKPFFSGVIKFDGEYEDEAGAEEPLVPPMNDPDDIVETLPVTSETAPITTTTAVTTTTKAPETTKKPETTTKKPETTKKPSTTVDKPVPDLSGVTDGAAAIVKVANSQIGVKEAPYNNVKYNTWYYGREVKDKNSKDTSHAWCVVFISWCADRAGISTDTVPKTAGVGSIMNFYKNAGRYKTRSSGYVPKVGDIAIFGNASHAGIVVACDGNTVSVVEGNYSDSVKLNTYKVGARNISGYCSPDYK